MQGSHHLPLAEMARLGEPVAEPLELEPPSLNQYAGSLALLVLAAAAFGYAVWSGSRGNETLAVGAAVLGLGLALSAAVFLLRRERRRATLGRFSQGLTLSRWGKTRGFPYDELRSLALKETEELANDVPVGRRRRLSLRSERARFTLLHVAPNDQPDVFGSWLDGAVDGMADAAERGLAGGRPLAGKGWQLTPAGLRIGTRETPVAELGAVGIARRRLSIWRGDEELPLFQIGTGTPNALVLARVLGRRLGEQAARETTSDGPGRLFFEHRTSRTTVALAVVVALAVGIPGALMLPAGGGTAGLGAVFLALGIGSLVAAAAAGWYRVRFHANAVVRRTLFGSRTLAFAEVEGLAYRAVAVYTQGAYAGTSVRMVLRSAPPAKKLVIKARAWGTPEDLERVRNGIATLIASRLAEEIEAGGEVEWAPSVWLSRDGLRFIAKRLVGSGEERRVDYRQEPAFDIQGEVFRLFLPPEKKPVLKIPCGRENFYPGFLLFQQLAWEAAD